MAWWTALASFAGQAAGSSSSASPAKVGGDTYNINQPVSPAVMASIFDGNGLNQTYIPPPPVSYQPSNAIPMSNNMLGSNNMKLLLFAGLGIIAIKKLKG